MSTLSSVIVKAQITSKTVCDNCSCSKKKECCMKYKKKGVHCKKCPKT